MTYKNRLGHSPPKCCNLIGLEHVAETAWATLTFLVHKMEISVPYLAFSLTCDVIGWWPTRHSSSAECATENLTKNLGSLGNFFQGIPCCECFQKDHVELKT